MMNSLMNLCRPVLKGIMVKVDESKVFVEIDFYLFVCYVYNYLTLIDLSNAYIFVIKEKQKNQKSRKNSCHC